MSDLRFLACLGSVGFAETLHHSAADGEFVEAQFIAVAMRARVVADARLVVADRRDRSWVRQGGCYPARPTIITDRIAR